MSTLSLSKFGVTALVAGLPFAAIAADCPKGFPSGPIKMYVGYSAGGGTDTVARKVAELDNCSGSRPLAETAVRRISKTSPRTESGRRNSENFVRTDDRFRTLIREDQHESTLPFVGYS